MRGRSAHGQGLDPRAGARPRPASPPGTAPSSVLLAGDAPSRRHRPPSAATSSTQRAVPRRGKAPAHREDRASHLCTVETVSSLTERPLRGLYVTQGSMAVKGPFLGITDRIRNTPVGFSSNGQVSPDVFLRARRPRPFAVGFLLVGFPPSRWRGGGTRTTPESVCKRKKSFIAIYQGKVASGEGDTSDF